MPTVKGKLAELFVLPEQRGSIQPHGQSTSLREELSGLCWWHKKANLACLETPLTFNNEHIQLSSRLSNRSV